MTRNQIIVAMAANSIKGEVSGSGSNWSVELANETAMRKFCRNIAKVGGYRTGYGAWIVSPSCQSMGDWNDRSSRWHY